ncbi:SEC-C metal-binding domain-containing protein [Pseudomonas fluorescens]|uniref:SEC-C metal-binding domain-containing protein n=1 Tax=Pseudomonas fluorescens TaxID=294 RepID=UPI0010E5265E|nr:SEC-C metal-binding domain-containing protein [Pseudomonas fluorescens]TCV69738.1 TPR repeat protein [Pseudomonas fluorescens]
MDDIQLALGASAEVGRLYKNGKDFSADTPVMALAYLRGMAAAFCNCLDRDVDGLKLDEKISSLSEQGLIKSKVRQQLRILQANGNKAAHPENYDFVDLNFPVLVSEALEAARGLIEHLYIARHEDVPAYEVTPLESGALRDMCVRAMLDRDLEAMNQAGQYFLERADQPAKGRPLRPDGYPICAGQDIEQAIFWFKQGADRDHPDCLYQYGYYLSEHLNNKAPGQECMGEQYISRAAKTDHPAAVFYLAESVLEGRGSFTRDEVHALELFERAAKLGYPEAMAQAGAMYASGVGCEVDDFTAALYILQAARAGVPQVQYNLFVLYMQGKGVMKIESEGIRWLVEAAAQGFPNAVYNLACCIQAGDVPGRAPSEAVAEYERAMDFQKFRARAALNAAELIYSSAPDVRDLVRAAQHLQTCYELLSNDGDPHELRDACLKSSANVVRVLRKQLNERGNDLSLWGEAVTTSALFDRAGVPVVDRKARLEEFENGLFNARALMSGDKYLRSEACLKTRALHPNGVSAAAPKLGRNDPCHCESGLKYKHCHGR